MHSLTTTLFNDSIDRLTPLYGKQEAKSLVFLIFENIFLLSRTEVLVGKELKKSDKIPTLELILNRLLNSEPLQYIIGTTEFYGNIFEVNPSVLIPRPETEELVQLIILENKNQTPISIIDIGTGSGCIAISLKKEIPQAQVYAADISKEALDTATKNAILNKVDIDFLELDILSKETILPETSIIVSNPPYVMHSEKALMQSNVLNFEPHLALFAEDSDPLIFYKAITEKALKYLLPKGKIYFEINEQFGKETAELLIQAGFSNVKILKDLSGKDRMVSGEKLFN